MPEPTPKHDSERSLLDQPCDPRERGHHPSAAPLILASTSPRRIALMKEHGLDVSVIAPPWDEPEWVGSQLPPPQRAEALSYFKARSVADRLMLPANPPLPLRERGRGEGFRDQPFAMERVLAGDTIVALENRVFGKPRDRDDARAILTALSGTTHHVITGVTLYDTSTCRRLIRHDTTAVTMRRLAGAELEAYLDTNDWAGKAGAYGIQDSGDAFIAQIQGSFTNVVGFPMELILQMLTDDVSP